MPRKPRDFSKEKIGKMQPLYIDETKPRGCGKNIYWVCECECGNRRSISSAVLQEGIKHNRNMSCKQCGSPAHDITGQVFGKLTALRRDETYIGTKENNWTTKWICQCECGNIVSVYTSNLKKLHTTSCGCASRSIGEENIEKILKNNKINFIREFSFPQLFKQKKLRFDFAIFDSEWKLSHLIEFDGRQHFSDYTPWNGTETLEERQLRDNMKDEYCIENNIRLIRIPYTKRDKITLKDLGVEK